MADYLVTGAAGFIASRVCQSLLSDGHGVVGLDNLCDSYDPRLKRWRLARLREEPGFEFQQLDICRRGQLRELVRSGPRLEAVINLAARAGVRQSVQDPWVYYRTNVIGTLNLLELCAELGITKFVLASTSSVYGEVQGTPFHESLPTDQPLSPYAASKKAAEALCYTYHYLKGLDVTVLRYFTVYGPAGRPDMSLFRFVKWVTEGQPVIVYGDGCQSRDFTYVEDIARGTVLGLKPLGYEIINLGSDRPVKLRDAIHLVESAVGRKAALEFKPSQPADVRRTWADIAKARRLLDWAPKWAFKEGVKSAVQWYRANRDWAAKIRTG
ncbi:MAG: NAD-dependent epimerase/dehydratase family protein [Acidobacteriota bacterium]